MVGFSLESYMVGTLQPRELHGGEPSLQPRELHGGYSYTFQPRELHGGEPSA